MSTKSEDSSGHPLRHDETGDKGGMLLCVSCSIASDSFATQWALPGSSVHGILQVRILEWAAIPFSRGSSWPMDRTRVSCIAGRFFTESVNSVQSLSHVLLFATPWTAARQASLSTANSWSLLKLISIKLMMPFKHLILCHPLLLLPATFPSIRVFSNESVLHIWLEKEMPTHSSTLLPGKSCRGRSLVDYSPWSCKEWDTTERLNFHFHIRWPKYWSFSFIISPSNEYSVLISFRIDWFDLLEVQGTLKSLLQHHSSKESILWHSAFLMTQLSHS